MNDTLFELLTSLERADSGLIEFDPEKHRETLINAEIKIDSYKYILTKYESKIEEIQDEIDQLQTIKNTLQRRSASFRSALVWILKEKKISQFPGVKWVVKLQQRKKISLLGEPDSKTFLALPSIVKRTYVWDKRAFDEAYKKDPQSLAAYAKEDVSEFVKFDLKRSIDD